MANPAHLLVQNVTVERVTDTGPPDGMGDPSEQVQTFKVRGYAWQVGRDQETGNRVVEEEEWRLVVDRRARDKITGGDRVMVEGVQMLEGAELVPAVFEVFGPPWPAVNPRTRRTDFLEVRLKRAG